MDSLQPTKVEIENIFSPNTCSKEKRFLSNEWTDISISVLRKE